MPQEIEEVNHAANIAESATNTPEHEQAMLEVANEAEQAIEQSEVDPIEEALKELYAKEEADEEEAHAEEEAEVEEEAEEEQDGPLDEWQERALAAEAALIEQAVYSAVGGQENYSKLIDWAGKNWTKEQQAFYDSVIENGSQEQVMFAVNSLTAMAKVSGFNTVPGGMQEGSHLRGRPTTPADGAFASDTEAFAAMENPLYFEESQRGEAYRRQVATRMAKSNVW